MPEGAVKKPLLNVTDVDVTFPTLPKNIPPDTVKALVLTVPENPQKYIPPLIVKPPV